MKFFSFGESLEGVPYKVLDERTIRASSGLMLFLGVIAFINGFILDRYIVIPWVAGFLLLNFVIGVFINPRFAPTMALGKLIIYRQSPLYIGAIQKRFAWSLGIALSATILTLSLFLQQDVSFFEPTCMLCIICLLFLYFESAFGICLGCKLYTLLIFLKVIKKPEIKPNCMGNACVTE